ncbi:hypothetical protein B296_00043456 [Ensete ventricosum]|uniref:Uncharacterized protein n=1 Tax=Ensete ventricosum TaxID=4639 RepID=A0A426XK25_ENSVE|nr:hypothetical protein B296_00043456 [Ensete ventricosum]
MESKNSDQASIGAEGQGVPCGRTQRRKRRRRGLRGRRRRGKGEIWRRKTWHRPDLRAESGGRGGEEGRVRSFMSRKRPGEPFSFGLSTHSFNLNAKECKWGGCRWVIEIRVLSRSCSVDESLRWLFWPHHD